MNRFKKNLLISYGLSLSLLIISAGASYFSIRNLIDSQKLVNHTNEIIIQLENVISQVKDAETGQRGFLLTGKEQFLEPYNGALTRAASLIDKVKTLTSDNPAQQVDCERLRTLITRKFEILALSVDLKRKSETISDSLLMAGKSQMDESRNIVKAMEDREQSLLAKRTSTQNSFAKATPILIIIASVLAIFITIVSFFRVVSDFDKRAALQKVLETKDEEISKRLVFIQKIAAQISSGDYKLKVDDNEADSLGAIAESLNKMSESLDYSFTSLKQREWVQSGIAELNEIMIGEKDLPALTYNILSFITTYTNAQVGAFYLSQDQDSLKLSAGIALTKNKINQEIALGQGLAGQCALSGKELILENVSDSELTMDYSAGSIKPKYLVAVPVFHETKLKGVVEIASVKKIDTATHEFLRVAGYNIGVAINSASDHQRLQELLAETQAQSEELQSQHSELENVNAELEAQAEKLQASEEELRVQQEELNQSNQELEERSHLLEEKNHMVVVRNIEIQKKAEELAQSTKYKSE
ncbi:MAG: CHASE3 domain-containing protein, partial [Bacteroidota bacterium]